MKITRIDPNTRISLKTASQIRGGKQLVNVIRRVDDLPGAKSGGPGSVLDIHPKIVSRIFKCSHKSPKRKCLKLTYLPWSGKGFSSSDLSTETI